MASGSDQTQTTINPTGERSFYTIAAAEEALRQEQQRNNTLNVKIDSLERTVGEKLDTIASLLQQLISLNASQSLAAPPVPLLLQQFFL